MRRHCSTESSCHHRNLLNRISLKQYALKLNKILKYAISRWNDYKFFFCTYPVHSHLGGQHSEGATQTQVAE